MDRYGASIRESESDDGYGDDYPRRGGPLDRSDDYDRGYGRGDLMRERGTFRGERSGRDHRLGLYDDEDSDSGRYDVPTHRRGTGLYTSTDSADESDDEPRDRYRGGAAGPRHRGFSPSTLDSYDNDSELEHGDRGVRGQGITRGMTRGPESRHPGPRFTGDYSDDESEFEPRTARGGHGGPGTFGPRLAREEYGVGGRRSMAPPHSGHRGPAYASSMDDESEYGESEYGHYGGPRREVGRDAPRGGMMHHRRRQGGVTPSEDDLDDSEDEDLRGGRRGAVSLGRPTGRGLY